LTIAELISFKKRRLQRIYQVRIFRKNYGGRSGRRRRKKLMREEN